MNTCHTHVHVRTYMDMYMYVHTWICTCTYIYGFYVHVRTYMDMYMYVHILCICTCMHIYHMYMYLLEVTRKRHAQERGMYISTHAYCILQTTTWEQGISNLVLIGRGPLKLLHW